MRLKCRTKDTKKNLLEEVDLERDHQTGKTKIKGLNLQGNPNQRSFQNRNETLMILGTKTGSLTLEKGEEATTSTMRGRDLSPPATGTTETPKTIRKRRARGSSLTPTETEIEEIELNRICLQKRQNFIIK